jgi:hypothetical protein
MAPYAICFVKANSNPVPDGTVVNAMDVNNLLVESSTIGTNGAPTGQGVAMFIDLVQGTYYDFMFPSGEYPNRPLTMLSNPQIIVGAPGLNAPYDLIQTFEVSNTGPTTIFTHVVARQFTLSQSVSANGVHQAYCSYAANTQTVIFNLNQNGLSGTFGTLTFPPVVSPATTSAGVFDISGTTTFNVGDFLSIDFYSDSDDSAVSDLNMNNFIITLCADLV